MAAANAKPLAGKVALVTGASRGIGFAIARALAEDGADVALAARSEAPLKNAAAELAMFGSKAIPIPMDVTEADQVARGVAEATHSLGHVDILVNNAGIAESAPLLKLGPELWERTLRTNLTSVYLCTRAALPGMLERGWGRVINVASVAGKFGFRYVSAYAASKHGVLGFTKSIALEVATQGVTVNAICPGYVDTDMADYAVARIVERTKLSPEEARRSLEQVSPQQRMFTPQEVAHVARMLAREEARGINGQAINICGGMAPY